MEARGAHSRLGSCSAHKSVLRVGRSCKGGEEVGLGQMVIGEGENLRLPDEHHACVEGGETRE